MNIGFAVIARENSAEFQLYTPQPQTSDVDPQLSLVNFARTADSAAVLMGRLYYRDEQLKKLPAPPAEIAGTMARNDAALALAVYHRWGRDGIEALEGDFSLVVRDARQQTFLAMRDPQGGYPLFWLEHENMLALSSGLPPLVGLPRPRAIDMEYVADFLMLPAAGGEELLSQRTAYEGINRLAPGSTLTIRRADGNIHVEQRIYWDWRQHIIAPHGKTLEDVGLEYEQVLRNAVRERMRGRTAAHFSGGMDSTAVALLAREEAVRAGDGSVHALALVYERMEVLMRETVYLESALQGKPGMEAHRVVADDILDFAMLIDPPAHDEPWTWLFRGGMNGVLLDAAAAVNAQTVFTGLGADEVLDSSPRHLVDLVRRGRLFAAWREAKRWARGEGSSPWNVLYPNGIRPLVPMALLGGVGPMIKSLLRRRSTKYKDQTKSSVPPWILPEFASRHRLRKRAIAHMRQWYGREKGLTTSQGSAVGAVRARRGDMSRWHSAAPRGIHVTHPFLDPRVVGLGMGIPDQIRTIPGIQKPVLGQAMRDILPEEIRNRRRKSHANEVYNLGLSRYLPDLEKIALDAPLEKLGIFDKNILVECLHQAALMGGGNMIAEERLNLSLALIQWASHIDQWNAALPPPSEVIAVGAEQAALA